jgi:hypothetical protein
MKLRSLALALFSLLTLAACGSQQVGYQITDRNHSLSVTREQQYPGSDWTNHVIVTRFPECQRRYKLKESPSNSFKLDVYLVEPHVYIFNHGKLWYIGETKACQWQKYDAPPPEPGELVGTFQVKNDQLVWIENPANKDKDAKATAKPAQ